MTTMAEFFDFHRENPRVYWLFCRFVRQVLEAGHRRYSARAIFHRIRWHERVETSDLTYKLNSIWSPYYARYWMAQNPQYGPFFETRVTNEEISQALRKSREEGR